MSFTCECGHIKIRPGDVCGACGLDPNRVHADLKALRERVGKVAEGMEPWLKRYVHEWVLADETFKSCILAELQAIAEGR